jgi:hypothetical protein
VTGGRVALRTTYLAWQLSCMDRREAEFVKRADRAPSVKHDRRASPIPCSHAPLSFGAAAVGLSPPARGEGTAGRTRYDWGEYPALPSSSWGGPGESRGLFPFAFLRCRLGPISTITTANKYVSTRPIEFCRGSRVRCGKAQIVLARDRGLSRLAYFCTILKNAARQSPRRCRRCEGKSAPARTFSQVLLPTALNC